MQEKPTSANFGRRILVVDDEPAVSDAIRMMLEFDGHIVQTAGSAQEALALFERGDFDLVITDYAMPEMKGDKLALAVKQLRPHVPVLMVTAHTDVLQASGNPLRGVDLLVSKPFMLEDLREAIFMVLPSTVIPGSEELGSDDRPDSPRNQR